MKQLKIPQVILENKELLDFTAVLLQEIFPHLSYCECCGLPWNACISKSVKTIGSRSTFATCDRCWDKSTLKELKQYYTNVYYKQVNQTNLLQDKMGYSLDYLLLCVEKEYTNEIS